MSSFLTLPNEILAEIALYTHPSTVANLASTSKRLFQCSHTALKLHRERLDRLSSFHDRHPLAVPKLLRELLAHPDCGWYIRNAEFYTRRHFWSEWHSIKHLSREVTTPSWPYVWPKEQYDCTYLEHEGVESVFTASQSESIEQMFSETLKVPEERLDFWVEGYREGGDEPLKLLVLSMSPCLSRLIFVVGHGSGSSPVHEFASFVLRLHENNLLQYHFGSLRTVVASLPIYYGYSLEPSIGGCEELASFFLLPSVRKIYATGTRDNPPWKIHEAVGLPVEYLEQKPYSYEWGRWTSTCTDLTLIHRDLHPSAQASFISACKALQYFEGEVERECLEALLRDHRDTLRSLAINRYFYPLDAIPYPRKTIGQWLTELNISLNLSFHRLSFLSLELTDLEPHTEVGARAQETKWLPLVPMLGKSTYSLATLQIRTKPLDEQVLPVARIETLIPTLQAFVQAAGAHNLTTLCVAQTILKNDRGEDGEGDEGDEGEGIGPWSGELAVSCGKAGVMLHMDRILQPERCHGCVTSPMEKATWRRTGIPLLTAPVPLSAEPLYG